ncbi:mucoidy inhibitor MuiA family protein [Streptomyces griseorubiginosus]|uniref:mucoidy inhibitor MuiA family protein n=1 Tax=Streptomyces griseorubiginosus TaxID=67304 RepID=UPI0036ED702B
MEIRPDSALHSVIVYASGALCRRRITVDLPQGATPLPVRIVGLPLTLAPESLRARVLSGPPGIGVQDVRHEVDVELASPEQLPQLQRELSAAERALQAARARRDRLAARIEATAGLRAVPPAPRRGDPPPQAPIGALLALASFVDSRLAELQQRLAVLEDELDGAEHTVALARRRLTEASQALPIGTARTTSAAVLTLSRSSSQEGGPAELELEYAVTGATWAPTYQLHLRGMAGGAPVGSLTMRACVAQRTGEDWDGVRLMLSTAHPGRRTERPELRSLRIGRRQEEPSVSATRETPTGIGELFHGYDAWVRTEPGAQPVVGNRAPDERLAVPAPQPVAVSAPAPGAGGATPPHDRARKARERALPLPPMASQEPQMPGRPPSPRPVGYGSAASVVAEPTGPGTTPCQEAVIRDYAGLVLASPSAPPGERGTLVPSGQDVKGAAAERRRQVMEIARLDLPTHSVPVRQSAGSFDYRYDTAAAVDVPADGAWHTVPIAEFPVDFASEYVCVPAADPRVYAAVQLTNTGDNALLAGAAEVTVDGEYLMTVALPVLAPGQRRRIGIGVAEGVQVARRVRSSESSAGLRGGTIVVGQRVEIELANRLERPVTVEVRERVPVSDEKDIRIEDAPSTPPWTVVPPEQDEDGLVGVRGRRLWRIPLEARSTTVLTGGHDLRMPAGKAVVGGNRRG